MKLAIILTCLIFCVGALVEVVPDDSFCYNDAAGCGPNTRVWPDTCHEGKRQSPIELPENLKPSGLTTLRMIGGYRGSFFRLQNSGHSVMIDFVGKSGQNEGPTSRLFAFPDSTATNNGGYTKQQVRQYKFAAAHFHWGKEDSVGSEHCIGKICASLELHLVHYLANYNNIDEAFASGNENAFAVLAVLANAKSVNSLLANQGHAPLAPIVDNLDKVKNVSHDEAFVTINKPLDLTRFILTEDFSQVYSYKGSLTTPGCMEIVNWFVVKRPNTVDPSDMEAFRSTLKDNQGGVLSQNHRPRMPLNGRKVLLSAVVPSL